MKFLILVCAAGLTVGCAGTPPHSLKSEGDSQEFEVATTPEATYRRVLQGARACYSRIFDVQADYFPEAGEGTVSASMKAMLTMGTAFVANVRRSKLGTTIEVVSHRSATKMPSNVKAWVTGNFSECDLS